MRSIIFILLFTPLLAVADPDVCKDLAALTCSDSVQNDGTGTYDRAKTVAAEAKTKEQVHLKTTEYLRARLSNVNDPFTQLAISAFGKKKYSECDWKTDRTCLDALVVNSSNFVERHLLREDLEDKIPNVGSDGNVAKLREFFDDPALTKFGSDTRDDLAKNLLQSKMTEKVQGEYFQHLKELLIRKINEDVDDGDTRALLVEKVRRIHWDQLICGWNSDAGAPGSFIDEMIIPNAFYRQTGFQVCNGLLLATNSEFTIIAIMAHELAHSIGPCQISEPAGGKSFSYGSGANQIVAERNYPFKKLLSCLRKPTSMNAQRQSPFTQAYDGFCGNKGDQIDEAFSDWMAAELTPLYMQKYHPELTQGQFQKGYTNALKQTCLTPTQKEYTKDKWDPHSEARYRINGTIMVNPVSRKQMGCKEDPPSFVYCPVESEPGSGVLAPSGERTRAP